MKKALKVAFWLLLLCTTCFSQSSFYGLTPGKSTRADVERVLGQPVKEHSPTLVEYHPPQDRRAAVTKVYVQYRTGSPIVERIEILLAQLHTRAEALERVRLPERAAARGLNAAGVLQEYFGPPFYVVLTYQDKSESGVVRYGSYSPELFNAAFAKLPGLLKTGGKTGVVKLNGNPVAGALVEFYGLNLPGGLHPIEHTDRNGFFTFIGPIGVYVVVVSGPGMQWTYVKGVKVQIPFPAPLAISAQPGDGSRPTQEQVMAAIR
jgi:hypothetical protein